LPFGIGLVELAFCVNHGSPSGNSPGGLCFLPWEVSFDLWALLVCHLQLPPGDVSHAFGFP
jgi:hypothetical protein